MTKSIFADFNEEVRQKHIDEFGVDIDDLTHQQKARHFFKHRVDMSTNPNTHECKIIQAQGQQRQKRFRARKGCQKGQEQ